jgi:HEAT repeat protein
VLCALWILSILVTRLRYIKLLTSMLSVPSAHDPEVSAYDGATVRMLEQELTTAAPARAAVILDLLEQSEHRASNELLGKLADADDQGVGALLVIDHLLTLRDARGLVEFAKSKNPNVAGAALLALDDVDPTAADLSGRQALHDPNAPEELRALAAGLLSAHNPDARRMVVQFAASQNAGTRQAAAQALSRMDPGAPAEVGSTLCKLAQDPEFDIARTALAALGRHLSPEACEVALGAVSNRRLRGAGMRALADLGPPAVPPISDVLSRTTDPAVAAALIWSLGHIGASSGVKPLVLALGAVHTTVRLSAAVALGALRRRRPDFELPLLDIEARHLPEIEFYGRMREGALSGLPSTPAGIVLRRSLKQRGQASLETLFRIMSLSYPEDAIQAAFQAITSRDRGQRQLALELLDAILALPTRQALADAIGEGTRRPRNRERRDIVADFARGQDTFLAELAQLVLAELDGVHPDQARLRKRTVNPSIVDQILELQAVTLFSQASAEDLAEVAALVSDRHVDKGEPIYREGEPGDALYLIRQGSVLLTRKKHKIDRLGPGDAFGIVSVLDRLPREQTATAQAPCSLLMIKATDLQQLLADRPLLMHSVFRALTTAIRNQLDQVALGKKAAD